MFMMTEFMNFVMTLILIVRSQPLSGIKTSTVLAKNDSFYRTSVLREEFCCQKDEPYVKNTVVKEKKG